MTLVDILFYVCLSSYAFAAIMGRINYKFFDKTTKVISHLIVITLLAEISGRALYILGSSQSYVYHFYCIIDFFIMVYYFLNFVKYPVSPVRLGLIGFAIFLLASLNCFFFQPLDTFNSNMLTLQSFVVIAMGIFALYRMFMNNENYNILNYPHFWFWTFFLLLNSCSYFFWPFIKLFYMQNSPYYKVATYFQEIINIICYTGIGMTFYYYPKMTRNDA